MAKRPELIAHRSTAHLSAALRVGGMMAADAALAAAGFLLAYLLPELNQAGFDAGQFGFGLAQ